MSLSIHVSAEQRASLLEYRARGNGFPLATIAVAGFIAALIAVPSPISASLSMGGVLSLLLAPVTLSALWRDTRGRLLLCAILVLVPTGYLIAEISLFEDPGRTFINRVFLYQAALPVGVLASVMGAYWCITILGLRRFLLLSFSGLLATAAFTAREDNPWKYGLALPISMLVMLILARNRPLFGLVVIPLLAAVSIQADFRSWTAILCIAAVVVVLAGNRWAPLSAPRVLSIGFVTVAAGVVIAWLITQAALAGMLGGYVNQRTSAQLESANGNLLLGGRPEWGAAIALWRENPLGIGIGVAPSYHDYWLAIRSMPFESQGLQEISTVAAYFLRGEVNFHSTFWTFWGIYGVAGIVFSVLALVYLIHASIIAAAQLRQFSVRAAVVLFMLASLWDFLFSPTVVAQLALALATALHVINVPRVGPNSKRELRN